MPSFFATFSVLALAGSALGHTRHHKPSGWRNGRNGRYGRPTGTGMPFPAGNETGVWGTGTGTGYPTGYYPTATAPYFYETGVPSVADAGQSTTTSTCTTSETVYVTTTNTHYVTVTPGAEESASSASGYKKRQATRSRGGRRTRTRQYGAHVPTTTTTTTTTAAESAVSTTTLKTVVASSAAPFEDSNTAVASTSSPSSPTARAAPAGGKRGLAYNNAALCAPFTGSSAITWAYNWAQTSAGLDSKFSFVPMLWGTNSMFTNGWAKAANDFVNGGGKELLAFNEPDHTEQANMAPAVAAAAYMTHIQPFAGRARLGSPAVTNGGGAMGLNWLTSFLSACSSCTIDFVAVHWYDSVNNVEYFKKHITDAHTKTGKPVWLTEFGTIDGSDAQKADFLRQVLPWLDSQDFVERYAYFMVAEGMMVSGGQMSAYGAAYAA